uniref:Uncharacterized protein n=1 Tax=Anguilla anguilla TaxID=7936 RepID=A0A0E9QWI1_ANGAN
MLCSPLLCHSSHCDITVNEVTVAPVP